MTEKEAGNKLCPIMSRDPKSETMCQGSDCAWWRWSSKNMESVKDVDGRPLLREKWTGYCGNIPSRG